LLTHLPLARIWLRRARPAKPGLGCNPCLKLLWPQLQIGAGITLLFVLLQIIISLMQVIDTSGQKCPAPLIATIRALKETGSGGSFMIITDSQNAFNNISHFLRDNKTEFSSEEIKGVWTLIITKKTSDPLTNSPEDYCSQDRLPEGNKVNHEG